jgi:hypothetical protein
MSLPAAQTAIVFYIMARSMKHLVFGYSKRGVIEYLADITLD